MNTALPVCFPPPISYTFLSVRPPPPSSTSAIRYSAKLLKAQSVGVKSGRTIAQGLGTVLFIVFASYGLGMWFGAKEIGEEGGGEE